MYTPFLIRLRTVFGWIPNSFAASVTLISPVASVMLHLSVMYTYTGQPESSTEDISVAAVACDNRRMR